MNIKIKGFLLSSENENWYVCKIKGLNVEKSHFPFSKKRDFSENRFLLCALYELNLERHDSRGRKQNTEKKCFHSDNSFFFDCQMD